MERSVSRIVTVLATTALVVASSVGLAAAEIRIGVLMPLTGKGAAYGQHQQPAIKMFLEDLEKTGKGQAIKLIPYDTRNGELLAEYCIRFADDGDRLPPADDVLSRWRTLRSREREQPTSTAAPTTWRAIPRLRVDPPGEPDRGDL